MQNIQTEKGKHKVHGMKPHGEHAFPGSRTLSSMGGDWHFLIVGSEPQTLSWPSLPRLQWAQQPLTYSVYER